LNKKTFSTAEEKKQARETMTGVAATMRTVPPSKETLTSVLGA
jgi:hypothetical protein